MMVRNEVGNGQRTEVMISDKASDVEYEGGKGISCGCRGSVRTVVIQFVCVCVCVSESTESRKKFNK